MERAQSGAFRSPRPGRGAIPCCQILASRRRIGTPHPTLPLPQLPTPHRRFYVSPPIVASIQLLIPSIYTPSGVAEGGYVEAPEELRQT